MQHEHTHEHLHDDRDPARRVREPSPGKKSTSAALDGPTRPITSGIVARKAANGDVGGDAEQAVAAAASSSGVGLPGVLQRKFEDSLGVDLSGVRIHTGDTSAHAASTVSAKAYTVGQDIHFGEGQYAPGSADGEHLLAHEVAHTVQQRGQTPTRQNKLDVSAPSDHAEVEADRAADAMTSGQRATVTGAPALAARKVFRVIKEDQREAWESLQGDDVVKRLRSEVSAWRAYRGHPARWKGTPGKGFDELNDRIDALVARGFREHILDSVGRDAERSLEEMVSITTNFNGLVRAGLTHDTDPQHRWSMSINAASDAAKASGFVPVNALLVKYTNRFGMTYDKPLVGGLFGFSANVKVDPTAEQGKKVEAKLGRGFIKLQIDGTAEAKNFNLWGNEDLPGPITVVQGPSADIPLGSVKASTGGVIQLWGNGGPPGSLDFHDLKIGATPPKLPKLPKSTDDLKKLASVNVKLAQGAIGAVGSDPTQEETFSDAKQEAELVEEAQDWKQVINGYETGHADIPIHEVSQPMQTLAPALEARWKKVEADKEALKREFGIEQTFQLRYAISGMASRRWGNAVSEAERKQKNIDLSTQRAYGVTKIIRDDMRSSPVFGPAHEYEPGGVGGGVDLGGGQAAPETDTVALEKLRAKKLEEARAQHPDATPAELEKQVDAEIGAGSNQGGARRVEVNISWIGKTVKFAQNQSPAPHTRNPDQSGANDGSGGGGGHGNRGDDGAGRE